jgi:hypothetical protein
MKNLQTNLSLTVMSSLALSLLSMTATAQQPEVAAPSISWAHIKGSGQLEILGSNFGTAQGTVKVEGAIATVQSWSNTLIDVTNPLNEPATAQITVATSGGSKATGSVFNPVAVLSSASNSRDTVTLVQLNGGGNQAHVSPGASVTVSFGYACNKCTDGIQFGLSGSTTPQACIFPTASAGASSVTLTAPIAQGLYYILMDDNLNVCQPVWDYGTPPVAQAIGSILVY